MGDAENTLPPSKKRAAGREISRDNPGLDDDEDVEEETGTFKRASDQVLAARRIVKVRRNQTSSTPSSNPFAGIRLVPPTEATAAPAVARTEAVTTAEKVFEETKSDAGKETKEGTDETVNQLERKTEEWVAEIAENKEVAEDKENITVADEATESKIDNEMPAEDDNTENEEVKGGDSQNDKTVGSEVKENEKTAGGEETQDEKAAEADKTEEKKVNGSDNADPIAESTQLSSFQQLSSSQNAFTGLAGTGFSTSSFTFGSASKDGPILGTGTGSLFGQKTDQPSFGFGLSNNGSSSIFNTTGSSIGSKNEGTGFPSMQEVSVETGEENEKLVFSADSVLFEFFNGGWKERGKGELRVNVSTAGTERARLLMRARGNYRLILNASLYPDMKLANMDKRGVTFACMNSTGETKDGLSTFALKFKDASVVEEFQSAVAAHKDKIDQALKTPENSPKASDE
ncbi:nuclear pore complex protein NUP50A-like [Mercurialis annua]|uniref:nuclear pore complex protein NUP50A-like n=1 Tax=Mercurialis annua TaxID=3986 RepID=UPI00215F4C32|nr:nuclear pore complex protein NUP50A-like [Mercurialis annua]